MDKKLLVGAGALGALALLVLESKKSEAGESPTPQPPEQPPISPPPPPSPSPPEPSPPGQGLCPPRDIPPTQPLFHIFFYDVEFKPYQQCAPTDLVWGTLTFTVRIVPFYPDYTSCCKLKINIYLDGHPIASKTIDMPTEMTDVVIRLDKVQTNFGRHWLYLKGTLLSPCRGYSGKDAYVEFPKPKDWQYCNPY